MIVLIFESSMASYLVKSRSLRCTPVSVLLNPKSSLTFYTSLGRNVELPYYVSYFTMRIP